MEKRKKISIAGTCYNESGNIRELYNRCMAELKKFPDYDYEVVMADNCSTDDTRMKLRELANEDKNFKVIFNANNFGPINSGMNAFCATTGDVVIQIAADLQDPPELITDFVKKFKTLYFDNKGENSIKVTSARPHGNVVILMLDGIDDIDKAKALKNKVLYMKRSDAKLSKGTWFIQELFDCKVIDDNTGKELGVITDVSETGANDVWHIKTSNGEDVFKKYQTHFKTSKGDDDIFDVEFHD